MSVLVRAVGSDLRCRISHGDSVARGGFEDRAHRAVRLLQAGVWSVGVDLLLLELGLFEHEGGDDHPAGGVHFARHVIGRLVTVTEELGEHLDDVGVGVLIVVDKDDMPARRQPRPRPGRDNLGLFLQRRCYHRTCPAAFQ